MVLKDEAVTAQFNNVGNNRVMCGIIAGIVFCTIGALIPIIYNFVHGSSRWLRLTSFPGMWLGLTILFASLNGVCLGVYIFGDVRQLRKFELSRPPISKPQPITRTPRQRPVLSPIVGLPITPIIPLTQPPPLAYMPHNASQSRFSTSTCDSSSSDSSYTAEEAMIHISPAYVIFPCFPTESS